MKTGRTALMLLAAALVAGSVVRLTPSRAAENWADRFPSKLTPALENALAVLPEDGTLDVYAVMRERVGRAEIESLVRGLPPAERHAVVSERLRSFADGSQARVRGFLSRRRGASGGTPVRVLWLSNAMRFEATADEIEAVRSMRGVGYLGVLLDYPSDTYRDDAALGSAAGTLYYDGFESGGFGPEWRTGVTGTGRIQVTGANGPIGSYHVTMDSDTDDSYSECAMILTVDLAGVENCFLHFMFKEFSDESDPEDAVSISEDGAIWYTVLSLSGSGSYEWKALDLDEAAANNGISFNSAFRVRFSWRDNYSIPTDGFAFDEITIEAGDPPPSPPTPNIVNLQAPQCWDVGVTGSGALILNIDSGVDYTHPDLVNQIWSNPGEAPFGNNGIDDDGNGYVDDFKGWDFEGNDNDPYPTFSSHGTNTAGIVCGDGTSGTATGMAPDASMAIAKIDDMGDYWEAQQYAVLIGARAITSSYSYKWGIHDPDYHLFRENCVNELLAGVIHANSIGNQGNDTGGFPIPFNISAPGNSPGPWIHPQQVEGGLSSVMGCAGINMDETLYTSSGQGPSAWEDITIYDPGYGYPQNPDFWDYPYGGWGGGLPGLLKPDVCTYTGVTTTDLGGGYYHGFGGTSAATPHLGGAFCLLISGNPFAAPRKISQALQETAEDKGDPGKDLRYGSGKIQVYDALLRLLHDVESSDTAPSVGDTVKIEISGVPGDDYRIVYSLSADRLEPDALGIELGLPYHILFQGTMPPEGHVVEPLVVPDNPSLIGRTVFLQGVQDDRAGATGRYLRSLVEAVTIQP